MKLSQGLARSPPTQEAFIHQLCAAQTGLGGLMAEPGGEMPNTTRRFNADAHADLLILSNRLDFMCHTYI
jgi:hypothetical protein